MRIELRGGWLGGTLIVDDDGIEVRPRRRELVRICWEDVDFYRFWSHARRRWRPAHRVITTGRLTVFARGGNQLVIEPRYAGLVDALDVVFPRLHAALGDAPSCAPFSVDAAELVHAGKGRLALADIHDVQLAGATLVVRRRGKLWPWAAEAMNSVDNVLALVEQLVDRGVLVEASEHSFVPNALLDKLRATASRHAALPRATLVDHD